MENKKNHKEKEIGRRQTSNNNNQNMEEKKFEPKEIYSRQTEIVFDGSAWVCCKIAFNTQDIEAYDFGLNNT